jgi:uracil-DNA glycosylase family 4
MKVDGKGKREVLIIGEAPGANEDRCGHPFVGAAGQKLQEVLHSIGVNLRRDCWITNSNICRPKHPDGKNRTPTNLEIGYCRPAVIQTIKELKPRVIVLLGASPMKSVLGWLWKEDIGTPERWRNWRIPHQRLNAWICPTWHPAALLHKDDPEADESSQGSKNTVMHLDFRRALKRAFALKGRPWDKPPDFKSKLMVLFDPVAAALAITKMVTNAIAKQIPIAFDYETNMLKPDRTKGIIYTCSMSDGTLSIAFPWTGAIVQPMKDFLRGLVPKIASNMKFEERWTRTKLGSYVRNWAQDTMLGAHVLQNTPGITSIKFQAFVLLGQDEWDSGVKPYLKAPDSNSENRIKQCDLRALLEYNAMDSLMEWMVARIQSKRGLHRPCWNVT